MCPGGEVVVCSTNDGELCVNGMSNRKRDSGTANSGILCDVRIEDFGSDDVLAGVRFQEKYEKLAFMNGGGDFTAPACSMGDFLNNSPEAARVTESLPAFAAEAIREADKTGDYSSEKAQKAQAIYYERHVEGAGDPPKCMVDSMENIGECYLVMQGPAEFVVTGKLNGWDIRDRLHEIDVPTMMLSGAADESTPLINKTMQDLIPGSKWVLIPNWTHMGHCYEPEPYIESAEAFLEEND
jgi:pimeloyl-ACP methyl ester carboxylesterase